MKKTEDNNEQPYLRLSKEFDEIMARLENRMKYLRELSEKRQLTINETPKNNTN